VIFHITTRAAWDAARAAGRYTDESLAGEGFIHFSGADQVVRVADARFRGTPDLVLLCVAPDRLREPLKHERSDAGEETFPHLYGALNLDAVVAVVPFREREGGGFVLPAEVAAH
jgi:uncharacterized protein (DUF952 family)